MMSFTMDDVMETLQIVKECKDKEIEFDPWINPAIWSESVGL